MEPLADLSLASALWRLAGVMALVFANGFFVAAEFSIVTVRKTRIDQLVAEGHRGARAVRRAITKPDNYIAATQVAITMTSLGLGWIGEPAVATLLQPALAFLPTSAGGAALHTASVAIAFALVTALHITLGELVPKTIALERAEATALMVVKPTEIFMKVFWPFIRLLNGIGRGIVNMLGMRGAGRHALVHSEEELKMLVTASQEAGVLEEREEQMLHRVFGFADLTAGQVMIPRTELVAVAADAPRDVLLEQIRRTGYSRLPVYRRDLDDVIGILHVTDLARAVLSGEQNLTPGSLARETLTVPEAMGADDLLAAIRRRGEREALVIDEYGGTAGLVTFESLMERIVGDAGGRVGGWRVVSFADGSADIDGLALTTDVNERFELGIDEDTYTTIGGFVLGQIGRPAKVGDAIELAGRTLRVRAIDGLRVAKVWLSPPPGARAADAPASDRAE